MSDEKVHDNEYLLANVSFHTILNHVILPQFEVDEMY